MYACTHCEVGRSASTSCGLKKNLTGRPNGRPASVIGICMHALQSWSFGINFSRLEMHVRTHREVGRSATAFCGLSKSSDRSPGIGYRHGHLRAGFTKLVVRHQLFAALRKTSKSSERSPGIGLEKVEKNKVDATAASSKPPTHRPTDRP